MSMIDLKERQVEIEVYAISSVNEGIELSSECTIYTEEENTELIYCGGVGKLIRVGASVVGVSIGDPVIFCGYTRDSKSRIIITATNNIARTNDIIQPIYALCGYVAYLINAVKMIKPSLGSDVIVFGHGLEGYITKQLLDSFGCNVYCSGNDIQLTDGRLADAAVLCAKGIDNNIINSVLSKCKETARVVIAGAHACCINISRQPIFHCMNSGSLAINTTYTQRGMPYPPHYVTDTVSNNLSLAIKLVKQGKVKFNSDLNLYTEFLKDYSSDNLLFLKNSVRLPEIITEIKKNYQDHINPGLLSMVWHVESHSVKPHKMLAAAALLLTSGIVKHNVIASGELYNINALCADGSVLNGSIIYGALKTACEISLHYDGSSIIYHNRQLQIMVGEETVKNIICNQIIECSFDCFEDSLGLKSWRELI